MSTKTYLLVVGLVAVVFIASYVVYPKLKSNQPPESTQGTSAPVNVAQPALDGPKSAIPQATTSLKKVDTALPDTGPYGSTIKVKRKKNRELASVNPEDAIFENDKKEVTTPSIKHVPTPSAALADLEWVFREREEKVSPSEAVDSVERYARALSSFKNHSSSRSLELLYRIGMRAAQDLTYVVEHVNEPTFRRIEADMEGFKLYRDRLFVVSPKLDYFSDLANTLGSGVDRNFFKLLSDYSNGDIPRHSRRINELLVCVNYGDGQLVTDYANLNSFKKHYLKNYSFEVSEKLDEVTNSFTQENCACGGKNDVFSEFKKFIKAYPDSKISNTLKIRMENIEREPADFRFHCKSNSEL